MQLRDSFSFYKEIIVINEIIFVYFKQYNHSLNDFKS